MLEPVNYTQGPLGHDFNIAQKAYSQNVALSSVLSILEMSPRI